MNQTSSPNYTWFKWYLHDIWVQILQKNRTKAGSVCICISISTAVSIEREGGEGGREKLQGISSWDYGGWRAPRSASWGPRRANNVVKKTGRRETKEGLMQEKTDAPAQRQASRRSTSYSAFLFYSGHWLTGWDLSTSGKAISLTQFPDSNVNLFFKIFFFLLCNYHH